jgi:hypothetical protein
MKTRMPVILFGVCFMVDFLEDMMEVKPWKDTLYDALLLYDEVDS